MGVFLIAWSCVEPTGCLNMERPWPKIGMKPLAGVGKCRNGSRKKGYMKRRYIESALKLMKENSNRAPVKVWTGKTCGNTRKATADSSKENKRILTVVAIMKHTQTYLPIDMLAAFNTECSPSDPSSPRSNGWRDGIGICM